MTQTETKDGAKVRTTVDLPRHLRDRMRTAVERGQARSQNGLIVAAIHAHLERLEEAWIDEQFAPMSDDESYRSLQLEIADSFARADSEVTGIDEGHDEAR